MIASFHLADVGLAKGLRLQRARPSRAELPGLRYAEMTIAAPLSSRLLPLPNPSRVGLIAAWDDDAALDRFLADHPLAAELAGGWRVRLQPTRIWGRWSRLDNLLEREQPMDGEEPAAVLTIGRLRLSQAFRFLRASAAAEELALRERAMIAATGLASAPTLVATFSLWRSTGAMRAYAGGAAESGHAAAVKSHQRRSFHHESAFIRFRPYDAHGSWDGVDPLAGVQRQPAQPSAIGA
jgi:hypothetical protein